jgi:hypothetical protein
MIATGLVTGNVVSVSKFKNVNQGKTGRLLRFGDYYYAILYSMKKLLLYRKDGKLSFFPEDGSDKIEVEYDENAPCRICDLPVTDASFGGTDMCPWCDSGYNRDGTTWTETDFSRFLKKCQKQAAMP